MLMESSFRYSLPAATQQPCYRGGPATLICKAVVQETRHAKTFVFEDSENRSFDFKPGQYVTFKFRIDDKVHLRAYSICSAPTRPHNIQVTVKRVPDGLVSNWVNDNLTPGTKVEIADIGGRFNYLDIRARKPLFLSGGSGITPVISMLQYITDVADPTDAVFVHFARTPKDIIFRDQLEFIGKRFKNVKIHLVVESDLDEPFQGTVGHIGAELMRSLVPDHVEREIFMCGPEGFMKAARVIAGEMAVAAIHEESFGEKIVVEDTGARGGEVYFSFSGKNWSCTSGETLLEAALNVGVWIDSSCQQGVCGSCKVRLTQGTVDMDDFGGLSDDERAEGFVLACCSRPRGVTSIEA